MDWLTDKAENQWKFSKSKQKTMASSWFFQRIVVPKNIGFQRDSGILSCFESALLYLEYDKKYHKQRLRRNIMKISVQFKVRMKTSQFEMLKAITAWISKENEIQKRGFLDSRQKQLNFRCRSLVQFKVRMKIWQFEMQKVITVWISKENEIQKRGFLDSRQKKLNIKCRSFVHFKLRMKSWWFKMSKPTTVWILKENTFKKRGFRAGLKSLKCQKLLLFEFQRKMKLKNVGS